ncbi:LuxR C-terminal-related transcriptional regulator [Pimelobacter simplex]|uniref:LuxR C-terminal-related transcriptional regulator n=1 Tax=Nocardioides simplex TaxID=2045 RepID=UPI001931F530|nr:LuxR family transcriptional regulator [Pimelobacter simplex]
MARGLTAERVRQDVDVVARAGLDLETFLEEALDSLRRAVPWESACVATHDPGTHLLTSGRKYGALAGETEHDHEFALIEYGEVEATAFSELVRTRTDAAGVHLVHEGEVERSGRMERFMVPRFGIGDEARVAFRDGRELWGAAALFRGSADRPFDAEEIDFLASLAGMFARGVRAGVLTRVADVMAPSPGAGPAVIIVGPDDRATQMTPSAEQWLGELAGSPTHPDPVSPVAALIASARRYARGETAAPPRCRLRTAGGMWLVLQAGPLSTFGDRAGDVVITIEEARPPEIVSLVVAAFGLTPRERDVTQLVLQGVDTKEIASTLHLSAYTVQDHLKSVFDKAGVRSRRELVSRVYFDQYVPRMGGELAPSGWFA